ncbi:unnamed protein product [Closterium sp. NIES-64]|nr:unnamed protein product [Closterium sp. NIES-64]
MSSRIPSSPPLPAITLPSAPRPTQPARVLDEQLPYPHPAVTASVAVGSIASPPTPLTSSHPSHVLPPLSRPPTPLTSSHPTHLLPPHSPPPTPLTSSRPSHLLPPHSPPPTPLTSTSAALILPPLSACPPTVSSSSIQVTSPLCHAHQFNPNHPLSSLFPFLPFTMCINQPP